jgi:hypothetical protein
MMHIHSSHVSFDHLCCIGAAHGWYTPVVLYTIR